MPPDFDRFDQLLKEWAQKPPAIPADEAARRVLGRLPAGPTARLLGPWLRLAAVATALVMGLLASQIDWNRSAISPSDPNDAVQEFAPQPIPDGVALIWLESGTPLFLTLSPPIHEEGDPTS